MNLPALERAPYDPFMALHRATFPDKKTRSRFVLPSLFVAFTAVGTVLGAGAPMARCAAGVRDASARESLTTTSAPLSETPVPLDLAEVRTPTAFPRLNPETNASRAWLVAEGPEPQPRDGRRYVTFTFDDGPFLETTPAILRVLAQRKVHATFFVVGQYLEGNATRAARTREILRDIQAGGHLVGNHTKDHRLLPAIPRSEAVAQIDDNAELIERTIGKKPTLFRPPFGELDTYTRSVVHDRGLELVLWSIEAADMTHDDAAAMAKNLRNQIEYNGGGIVLLHDIRPTTLPTLKRVLEFLHEKRWRPEEPEKIGYQVVDLPTYFALTEAWPRPQATRDALETARHEAFRKRHPGWRPPARDPETREGAQVAREGAQTSAEELAL